MRLKNSLGLLLVYSDSMFQISVVTGKLVELPILAYFNVGVVMDFLPSQSDCISSAGGLLLGDSL